MNGFNNFEIKLSGIRFSGNLDILFLSFFYTKFKLNCSKITLSKLEKVERVVKGNYPKCCNKNDGKGMNFIFLRFIQV